jgi:pimeloyl-ACP methyl ester carboxylesterase
MLEAVRRPRHGFQSPGLDRRPVHHTAAERPVLDPSQCAPYLLQHGRVELCFRERLTPAFVGHTRVSDVTGRIQYLSARGLTLLRSTSAQARFEFEQAALVVLHIHGSSLQITTTSSVVSLPNLREGLRGIVTVDTPSTRTQPLTAGDSLALRGLLEVVMSQAAAQSEVKNVVLVHGGFVDGSGWQGVYKILKKDGYTVSIVQNPTTTLADDVAVTRRALGKLDGPAILVGHSYGGAVITEAGSHPKVAGLVYIAAFAPDSGESVSKLIENPAPGAPVPPILPPQDGFLFLDKTKFAASFAADVSPDVAAFMSDSQVPWGVGALGGAITVPAWKVKPSWYLVTTEDRMIPPEAQRAMSKRAGSTVVEVRGSHSVYVSQPQLVASIIETAAQGVGLLTTTK